MSGTLRFLVAAVLLTVAPAALARTWTDNSGKQINAKFVRVHQGNVVLSRGGRVLTVPFSSLSPEDQDYVRQELEAKGQGDLVPPAGGSPAANNSTPGRSAFQAHGAAQDGGANAASAGPGAMRTWTDIQGRTIQAQFVRVSGGYVILLKDGQEVSFPLAGFSAADQQYIRSQTEGGGQTAPPRGGAGWPGPRLRIPFRPFAGPYGGRYGEDHEDDYDEDDGGYNDYRPGYEEDDSDDEDDEDDEQLGPGYRWRSPREQYRGRYPYDQDEEDDDSSSYDAGYSSPSALYDGPPSPYYLPSGPGHQRAEDGFKQCMECDAVVPGHLKAGDRCPECGVQWDMEQTESGKWVDEQGRDVSYNAYGRNAVAVGAGVGLLLLAALLWRAFLGQS